MRSDIFKQAWRDSIPVFAGYILLGMGFGILLQSKGFGVEWAIPIAIFVYAGSLQYVSVEWFADPVSYIAVAITTLMINARQLFYGMSMIERFRGAGWKKWYMAFALTDETYTLISKPHYKNIEDEHEYIFRLSLLNHIYWVMGCALGAAAGSRLPFDTKGIDFVLTALFLAILFDRLESAEERKPAAIGVVCSVVSLFVFGPERFLVPAMILICAALLISAKEEEYGDQ